MMASVVKQNDQKVLLLNFSVHCRAHLPELISGPEPVSLPRELARQSLTQKSLTETISRLSP